MGRILKYISNVVYLNNNGRSNYYSFFVYLTPYEPFEKLDHLCSGFFLYIYFFFTTKKIHANFFDRPNQISELFISTSRGVARWFSSIIEHSPIILYRTKVYARNRTYKKYLCLHFFFILTSIHFWFQKLLLNDVHWLCIIGLTQSCIEL